MESGDEGKCYVPLNSPPAPCWFSQHAVFWGAQLQLRTVQQHVLESSLASNGIYEQSYLAPISIDTKSTNEDGTLT